MNGDPLVRVGEKYLYSMDIEDVIPVGIDSLDSISLTNKHINNWVQNELLLLKAELNLREEQMDFEKQLEDYKSSLIIYAYEQELIRQKLDTNVSEMQIANYYEQNKDNFELKRYIVKVRMIKVDKQAPKLSKVKEWILSDNEDDLGLLDDYCLQFSSLCLLEDSWMFFDELVRMVPLKTLNIEDFLTNNKYVETEGRQFLYLLNIVDYKLKKDQSPLELEKDRIKNVIVNKRKLELLSTMRQEILNEAMTSNTVEFFENK